MNYDAGAKAYDQLTGRWSALFAKRCLELARAERGHAILDLAAGTGDASLVASTVVDTEGTVVAADLSVPMLRVARSKLEATGVFTIAADATKLPLRDTLFDAAVCLFGLMFFPDPIAGLREMRRVLKPGAWAAVTVWEQPQRAPFAGLMAQALAAELPREASDILKPFSLADPTLVASMLQSAGFVDVERHREECVGRLASAAEYFLPYERGAGRLGQYYLSLSTAARDRVRDRVSAMLRPWTSDGSIELRVEAWIAAGRCRSSERENRNV